MGQSAEELRYEIADTRAELGQTLDAIGDRVSPGRMIERRKNRFVVGMRSAKDRIMGTASDAGHAVTDRVQGVGEGIADTAGSAVDTVRSAPEAARQQAQGNPMMAGAVAFGVGFLVAAAFPPSRAEEQLAEQAMDKAEPVKQQLHGVGPRGRRAPQGVGDGGRRAGQADSDGERRTGRRHRQGGLADDQGRRPRRRRDHPPGGHEPLT